MDEFDHIGSFCVGRVELVVVPGRFQDASGAGVVGVEGEVGSHHALFFFLPVDLARHGVNEGLVCQVELHQSWHDGIVVGAITESAAAVGTRVGAGDRAHVIEEIRGGLPVVFLGEVFADEEGMAGVFL